MIPQRYLSPDRALVALRSLPRDQKMGLAIVLDGCLVALSVFLTTSASPSEVARPLLAPLAQLIMVAGSCWLFLVSGLYRAVVRYIGGTTLRLAAYAGIGSGVLFAIVAESLSPGLALWQFALYCVALVSSMITSRLAMRGLLSLGSPASELEPVIILGAGRAGSELASAIQRDSNYRVVAFLDDDAQKIGSVVRGVSVFPRSKLKKLIDRTQAERLFLAVPGLSREEKRQIIEFVAQYKIRVQSVPRFHELISGEASIDALQEVAIEDILGRNPVSPDFALLGNLLEDKVVLVSGAGGSIGSELCREIVKLKPRKIVLFELSEYALYALERELRVDAIEVVPVLGTVLDSQLLRRVLQRENVQLVYHAAAYKHVPLVEANACVGVKNNVMGTLKALEASQAAGIESFTLVSTDKAVNPTNVMGASKRVAELLVQAHSAGNASRRWSMVRFGNVLGSSGSVFPLFREQIAKGGPLTVTHPEVTRFFMTIPEAAQLVLQASAMAEGGEVFVLDMGEPVRIADLAKRLIQLSGLTLREGPEGAGEIEIRFTGLRPGEKLYEELLLGDNVLESTHPRVMRALEQHISWEQLAPQLAALELACQSDDVGALRRILGALVESFPVEPVVHTEIPVEERFKAESTGLAYPV
jgi:FlaA1/EpsC-like NDP-sugar epimerase